MNINEERKQGHISESKEKQRKSTAYQNTSVLEVETNRNSNNNNLNNSLISKNDVEIKDSTKTTSSCKNNMRKKYKVYIGNIICIGLIVLGIVALAGGFGSMRSHTYGGVAGNITGTEELMKQKEHGTCVGEIQKELRWQCDRETADRISCFNRHYAEHSGYWEQTSFLTEEDGSTGEIYFYDSVTGKELFVAPRGRTFQAFIDESKAHGWPSFRDKEVNQQHVRILPNGETVSIDGTHLGHNLPDGKGNRYCINLVSIAGHPSKPKETL